MKNKLNANINFVFCVIDIHRDGNIDWKCQISHVCSKTAKISGILCRTRHNLPGVFMQSLYYALIYRYLIYGNIASGNTYTTRLEPIRRLQKRIISILLPFSKISRTYWSCPQRTVDFTSRWYKQWKSNHCFVQVSILQ